MENSLSVMSKDYSKLADQKDYKLIDGKFSVEEAKDVLSALFRNKIKFHQQQRLSIYEREGRDTTSTKKRIAELKEEREKVREMLNAIENEDVIIEINGKVEIKVLK
ncbi:hypothetical protein OO013_05065 [Mangrovivirga sp. M17]|uniref:Uncharacterized protein n=1 Tax=Mangrovivirga halotolerans TaxID=2993936 RepID=A0ABT3RNW2_9BACT|nr:hypothetical protein [Mangrovivirga halotolerans]MCX2743223.1 hypothetical protein [Mangrovivirga halotolerans]